jgi:hypothetical protein
MSDTPTANPLFQGLVFSLAGATMQQLGKVKNPITDKMELDLDAARQSIDLLGMLADKTAGNLTPDEDKLLKAVLRDLRLNYVDTANDAAPKADASAPESAPSDSPKA